MDDYGQLPEFAHDFMLFSMELNSILRHNNITEIKF